MTQQSKDVWNERERNRVGGAPTYRPAYGHWYRADANDFVPDAIWDRHIKRRSIDWSGPANDRDHLRW